VYEHERNDAMCEVDETTAKADAQDKQADLQLLPMKPEWRWEAPKDAIARLNG